MSFPSERVWWAVQWQSPQDDEWLTESDYHQPERYFSKDSAEKAASRHRADGYESRVLRVTEVWELETE